MLALTEIFELICVFTLLAGSACAISSVVLPMYVAEISSDHIRGYLGIIHTVTAKTGALLMFGIGPFVSVRSMAWLCTIPILIFLAIFYWLPESPYQSLSVNDRVAAEISLQRLRCTNDVKEELDKMEANVSKSKANQGTFRELFCNARNRRSITVVLGFSALGELYGSHIVLQYAQTIFATLDTSLEPKYASIIFGVVQLSAAISSCFLVDTIGRRPLLFVSVVGSGTCTMAIGVYFVLERNMIEIPGFKWLAVTALLAFMFSYTIGIMPLLNVMTAELFPKHLKGVAGATKYINGSCIGLVLVQAYQYGVDEWGSDYVFIGFSLVTCAFIPFVMFVVPETKRKSLDTILSNSEEQADTKL